MKASFRITNPNMLAEAQAGDLFVPLGPDLVECVCALRCSQYPDGFHTDMPDAARFNPDALLGVVVVACRVNPGEPEYYPPGFWNKLSGAAPIQFLQQCEALQLQARGEQAASSDDYKSARDHLMERIRNHRPPNPLYADLGAMQADMDSLTARQGQEALNSLRRTLRHGQDVLRRLSSYAQTSDLGREELTSKL